MSRKRSLSTDISVDPKLAALAEYGVLPLLLYTWAIPHADDYGRITADAVQFRLMVCPALDVTRRDVDDALDQIAAVGLWERGEKVIQFPADSWRKSHNIEGKERRAPWKKVCKKLRAAVLARDGRTCRYCGRDYFPEVDHIRPVLHGGGNELDNLQILCRPCNRKKWAHLPVEAN